MSSSVLRIETPEAFEPLLLPARYKGAHGGRGSAKSHFFAGQAVGRCISKPRTRGVCIREVQRDLKESAKLLIEDKIRSLGAPGFVPLHSEIKTPGGGLMIFRGMQDYTADSIKSLEGFDFVWVEEAHTLSERSLELLRPTIRAPGSELWFSWNPVSASDPIDQFLRGEKPPPNSAVVQVNWRDNPWFPEELEAERLHDLETKPDRYGHIWEGDYEPIAVGAIWTRQTLNEHRRTEAPDLERIVVSVDPAISAESGSDEHGITVEAKGRDGRGYVLDDVSMKGTPQQWAERAVATYDRYEADCIVIERNQGGDMCRHTLKTVRPNIRIVDVVATRGKHVRAEPISALYALGRVSHVGSFTKLEAQMCQMTAAGYEGDGSPDRVDSLVWGMTELFPQLIRPKRKESKPGPKPRYSEWAA